MIGTLLHPARLLFIGCLVFLISVAVFPDFFRPRFEIANSVGSRVELAGYVAEEPILKNGFQQIILMALPLHERVLITTKPTPEYHFGEQMTVQGELEVPVSSVGEDGFNYRIYLAKDGIGAIMRSSQITPAALELPRWDRAKIAVFGPLFRLRGGFLRVLDDMLRPPHAAFVAGILVGARSQLPNDLKADFARTGVSHIVAVSGFNTSVVAAALMWLLLMVCSRRQAFWFTVAGLLAFTVIAGAEPSVVRASIMGIAVLVARYAGRLSSPAHLLVLVGTAMVVLNPMLLRYDIGFQLSFLATAGLLIGSPILEDRFAWIQRLGKLGELATMTISAQLFTLPILLYYFKTFSLLALPVNLVVLPLVPPAMLLGFITGVAGWILPSLGHLVAWFTTGLSSVILGIVRLAADVPWSAAVVSIPWYGALLCYALLATVLFFLYDR